MKPVSSPPIEEAPLIKLYPTTFAKEFTNIFSYADCDVDELKKFIHGRKLIMDGYKRPDKKSVLIRRLNLADKEPQHFPFFDLPPELRNPIYTDLLTFTGRVNKERYYLQILYTCRQAASEARNILYIVNNLTLKIPRKMNFTLPGYLHNLVHLTVYANYVMDPNSWIPTTQRTDIRLHKTLLQMCRALEGRHSLESLTIHIDEDRIGDARALFNVCRPVAALGPLASFNIVHDALGAVQVESARRDVMARALLWFNDVVCSARAEALNVLLMEAEEGSRMAREMGLPETFTGRTLVWDKELRERVRKLGKVVVNEAGKVWMEAADVILKRFCFTSR